MKNNTKKWLTVAGCLRSAGYRDCEQLQQG